MIMGHHESDHDVEVISGEKAAEKYGGEIEYALEITTKQ